jgi:hypothetical protein
VKKLRWFSLGPILALGLLLVGGFHVQTAQAAFPQVADVNTEAYPTVSVNHAADMPATVAAGDLLILAMYIEDGARLATTPTDWTLLGEDDPALNATGSSGRLFIYAKDAVGDEDGTTVNVVTNASRVGASIVYQITAASWGGDLSNDVDIASATIATASGAAGDPAAVTAGWGSADNLFIVFSATADDPNAHTAAPTNYDDLQTIDTGAVGAGGSIGSATRELAAASDDPGVFTFTTSPPSFDYTTTIVIEPAGGGGGASQVPKIFQQHTAANDPVFHQRIRANGR